MKLHTKTQIAGFTAESTIEAKVTHSQRKQYKGAKMVRVQNETEQRQAGAIDNKIKWAKHRQQRKAERKMRQEGIS